MVCDLKDPAQEAEESGPSTGYSLGERRGGPAGRPQQEPAGFGGPLPPHLCSGALRALGGVRSPDRGQAATTASVLAGTGQLTQPRAGRPPVGTGSGRWPTQGSEREVR